MQYAIVSTAGALAVLATVPYIRDVTKKKTKPKTVTWFTWSILNFITAAASFSGGAKQTAFFAGVTGLCTGTVAVLGIRNGVKKYALFDIICQIMAITGIIAWQITNNPAWAVVFTISASFIGLLPTLRHSWVKPKEETWQFYAMDGLAAGLIILVASEHNFISIAFPMYILLSDVLVAGVILKRRA